MNFSLALNAFAGAQPEANCLNFRPWTWENLLKEQGPNFEITYRGIRVTQRAEAVDFQNPMTDISTYLFTNEGQGQLHLEFTITCK